MKSFDTIVAIALVVVCVVISTVICTYKRYDLYNKGYLEACKDFYKGKVKADLIEREDGSKEWIMLDTNKEVLWKNQKNSTTTPTPAK